MHALLSQGTVGHVMDCLLLRQISSHEFSFPDDLEGK